MYRVRRPVGLLMASLSVVLRRADGTEMVDHQLLKTLWKISAKELKIIQTFLCGDWHFILNPLICSSALVCFSDHSYVHLVTLSSSRVLSSGPDGTYEDLKRAVVNKYGGPEIVTELHAQYYGTRQAVGESTDSFLSRKRRIAKRIFPNITEEKSIATCRFLVIFKNHRNHATPLTWCHTCRSPVVPERAQGLADRQAPGGAYLDEKDAANDMTAGDAAEEFLPQKTGYLYHSQEPIEDRDPDLHTVRDDEQAGQVGIEPIGDRESYQRAQPPLEHEHGEITTAAPPPEDAPAVSAERIGKKLDDDLQLQPLKRPLRNTRHSKGNSHFRPLSHQNQTVNSSHDHHNHNTIQHLDGVNHDSQQHPVHNTRKKTHHENNLLMQNVDISADCRCHNRTQLFNNVNHDPQDLVLITTKNTKSSLNCGVRRNHNMIEPFEYVNDHPQNTRSSASAIYLVETEDRRSKPLRRPPEAG
ncbi:hypothetical protein GEV33_014310 [Tenebrio molitor]|uniref:Uncharacterized protein n=1 Tax=Tenebrio molitor TaxID=7067 RepID=A0A8J6H5V7_TENMO|nr:hypothetical protein GEV33_014310 [Tenebrio molitor]